MPKIVSFVCDSCSDDKNRCVKDCWFGDTEKVPEVHPEEKCTKCGGPIRKLGFSDRPSKPHTQYGGI